MKLRYLALPLWLGSVAIALAQTTTTPTTPPAGGRGGPGPHGPGGNPIVRALDTDGDGTLSAVEIAAANTALAKLDTNTDGTISADELHPKPPADAPARPAPPADAADHPHPTDPIMLALDADKNDALSALEISNAPKSLLALDLNKDGKLTPDEYRPLPPERTSN